MTRKKLAVAALSLALTATLLPTVAHAAPINYEGDPGITAPAINYEGDSGFASPYPSSQLTPPPFSGAVGVFAEEAGE